MTEMAIRSMLDYFHVDYLMAEPRASQEATTRWPHQEAPRGPPAPLAQPRPLVLAVAACLTGRLLDACGGAHAASL